MATAGLLGPLTFLILLGINVGLGWRYRHALVSALLGRGFAAQVLDVSPPGETNVVALRVRTDTVGRGFRAPAALRLAA